MKTARTLLLVAVVAFTFGAAVYWSARSGSDFATPIDCLEAYREACLAGRADLHLVCLAEPLRAEFTKRFPEAGALAAWGKASLDDVVSWTALEPQPEVGGSGVLVDVEETRRSGRRRVRFHLQPVGRGWLIRAIDPPQDLPVTIPFGTHVRETPDQGW